MTSRPPPPRVLPLLHEGVRYQPDAAQGGRLVAFDAASGEQLWAVTLWTIANDPDAPPNPGRWFGRIALGPGRDDLLVECEYGERFLVDRVRRTVHPMPRREGLPPDGR